jgi:hypothetical protein
MVAPSGWDGATQTWERERINAEVGVGREVRTGQAGGVRQRRDVDIDASAATWVRGPAGGVRDMEPAGGRGRSSSSRRSAWFEAQPPGRSWTK